MNARETAAALYATRDDFLEDEYRYLLGPGWTYCTDTAYVLAHRVNVGWPIERMRHDVDSAGDCWFVFVAAGDLREIAAALRAKCPLKWVAFEREDHPHLLGTKRFLDVRSKKEQQQG